MFEIASQMILCLLLAALLGAIIGYILGKGTCAGDECEEMHTTDTHEEYESKRDTSIAKLSDTVPSNISTQGTAMTSDFNDNSHTKVTSEDIDVDMLGEDTTRTEGNSFVQLKGPRNGEKDNLTRIKGIGLKIDNALNEIGIYHFDQIASWNDENIAWADEALGFPGRAKRESWVEQAKALAAGEETEFSKRVDAGDVTSSKKV